MFKYFKLIAAFKDVREVYEAERTSGKPWWLSRRFFGAVMVFFGLVLAYFFDVRLTPEQAQTAADSVTTISQSVEKLVTAGVTLYGIIMTIVGAIKRNKGGDDMRIVGAILLCLLFTFAGGCTTLVNQSQKIDASMATYLGVEKLSPDCKAALAQVDADISADPVNMRNIAAVTKYADKESNDYKTCYVGVAWLYYTGKKVEGAVRTWLKKLTDMGVIVP